MTDATRPRVFVTRQIPEAGLSKIQSHCEADVWTERLPPSREELLKRVGGCGGLLTLLTETVDAELMDAAGPQLKVVSNYAVGFNNIDVEEATSRGIRVGNTPGVLTEATADMAMTLLLAAARRIWEAASDVRAGRWKTWEPKGYIGRDLVGQTLGIVGMGRIGTALAKKCRGGWDMKILYYDQYPNEAAENDFAAEPVDLETLLAESDFVSVHTNLDDSTRGMFNRDAFRKMKSTAVFINTARGPLHDSQSLYEALKAGEIFAAGLDVTDPEPISADDPLLMLPNCLIVPHIASATVASRNGMAEIAADNLLAGLKGQPLRCWVNPEAAE
jgi:glyoxylate reductase